MASDESRPLLGEIQPRTDERSLQSENYLSQVQNRGLYLATFASVLGPLSFGFVLGYSSPAIPSLKQSVRPELQLDASQESWFGSVVTLGAAAGGILGGFLVERAGRKLTLMLCAVPFVFGFAVILSAQNAWMLYLGRVLTGVASGVTSLAVPIYISEIAHSGVRGMLGSCVQLMVVIGILGAYTAGLVLEWRWLAVLCCVPPCLLLGCMAFMPETPRFLLLRQKQEHEAVAALRFLRGPQVEHHRECLELQAHAGEQEALTFAEFKNPSIYKPFCIGISMMFFQQVSGINAIMFYAETIFKDANFKNSGAASVIVGSIQVFFTAVAALLIDKTGRKVLLVLSGLIMAASAATFGMYSKMFLPLPNNSSQVLLLNSQLNLAVAEGPNLAWLSVLSLGLFIAGFALGWGPIPWLLMSEISPLRARGAVSGACVLTNWTMAFLVTKEFSDLTGVLTPAGTFWLFSTFCLFSVLFTIFWVPETRGRSLEEIEAAFQRSH